LISCFSLKISCEIKKISWQHAAMLADFLMPCCVIPPIATEVHRDEASLYTIKLILLIYLYSPSSVIAGETGNTSCATVTSPM
jgi:hypothetical protein